MNVNAIFDAVNKASKTVHLQDAINNKKIQIRSVTSERCGNCFHWMKTSCVPEEKHGRFKSCNGIACKEFSLTLLNHTLIDDFKQELVDLQKRLVEVLKDN